MTHTTSADVLAPLTPLPFLAQGPSSYFSRQIVSPDDSIRVGAWLGLIEADDVRVESYPRLIADCAFPAVRDKAFEFFVAHNAHDEAAQCINQASAAPTDVQQDALLAELRRAPEAIAEAQLQLYLSTGMGSYLSSLVWAVEQAYGPRAALERAVRCFAAQPFNAALLLQLIGKLDEIDDADLTRHLTRHLADSPVHKAVSKVVLALAQRQDRDHQVSLATLNQADADPANRESLAQFQGFIQPLRARLLEDLGQYRKAFDVRSKLHAFVVSKEKPDRTAFFKALDAERGIKVTVDPASVRQDHFQMTGFARSLPSALRGALSAHPQVEVLDEPAAIAAARSLILGSAAPNRKIDPAVLGPETQSRYYDEIARRRLKPEAAISIDVSLMQAASAPLLGKLFPGQRYIFCLRHPFDVVISCFRHRFPASPATANLHAIAHAIQLYDVTMTQWFTVHDLNDPLVCYVRAERLALDFHTETERLMDFLNIPPLPEAIEASGESERRGTGSTYDADRECSWRHFDFAFAGDEVKPLRKWVDFLGYESK